MIADLIEFGEWLSQNRLDEFAKNLNEEEDYLFCVKFNNASGTFEFDSIKPVKGTTPEDKVSYYVSSIFNDYYYITTDQKVIKPSNSNLIGITPFLLKLDHDFFDKNYEIDKSKAEKFYKKVERSKNANGNGKEFIELISSIYKDSGDYISKLPLSTEEINNLRHFFQNFSFNKLEETIKNYYNWLDENKELLVKELNKFKKEKGSKELKKSNFYLICYFNSEMDLLNDIFYYYSKFLKKRKEDFKEIENAPCSFCEDYGNVYPSLGDFVMGNAAFSFNYDDNKDTAVKNSRIKFCKKCSIYSMLAEDKLMKILPNNILIIPKRKNGSYGEFLREMTKDESSFKRINNDLNKIDGFNFDLAFYTNKKQGKGYIIEKYIENYRSYLAQVRSEEDKTKEGISKINLYSNEKMNYLSFAGSIKISNKEPQYIQSIFDFEPIFKQFFVNIKDSKFDYPKLYHFYQIYTRDLTGKTGIVGNLDSKTFTIFSKYMHSIFNFIYELNPDAIDKSMINEITLNCLIKITKNMEKPMYPILKRLNYYLMLNKELLGDNMLEKNDVNDLKKAIGNYEKDNPETAEISELIQKNPSLKYYLIGKFLKLVDGSKYQGGKKADIFNNFVTNANRNNIKSLFVTEVLQKNNYYIQKMNPKGKLVFKLIESDLNSLFNEQNGLSFEDYLLSIFAGYYTENILKKGGDLDE
jgi:CRISPR-associated protein Csh1